MKLGGGDRLDDILDSVLPPGLTQHLPPWVCFVLLIIIALIILILILRLKSRALIPVLITLIIGAMIWLIFCRSVADAQTSRTVTDLEPVKVYFWNVVAETEDGVTAESQTLRFETKE